MFSEKVKKYLSIISFQLHLEWGVGSWDRIIFLILLQPLLSHFFFFFNHKQPLESESPDWKRRPFQRV